MADPYADEPLLAENNERFCMFPIKCACHVPVSRSLPSALTRARARATDPDIWEMYKKAEASFWTGASARPRARCRANCDVQV